MSFNAPCAVHYCDADSLRGNFGGNGGFALRPWPKPSSHWNSSNVNSHAVAPTHLATHCLLTPLICVHAAAIDHLIWLIHAMRLTNMYHNLRDMLLGVSDRLVFDSGYLLVNVLQPFRWSFLCSRRTLRHISLVMIS